MTDEPLRANPDDRPAPPSGERKAVPGDKAAAAPDAGPDSVPSDVAADPAVPTSATAHTRPIRPARARPVDRRPAWSGFLLGVLVVGFAIGLAGLLWRFGGGESMAPAAALAPEELVEMETLLDQLGFPPGKLDGVVDDASVAAIRDFQLTAGLPVDGAPSAALLEELRAALAELQG